MHHPTSQVRGIMGTSAGALSGSLFAAGYSADEVASELSRVAPIELLQCNWSFWEGLFTYDRVVARLRQVRQLLLLHKKGGCRAHMQHPRPLLRLQLLPPRFEDLETDFAVGVMTAEGQHAIIDSGDLPTAVAASAAIPLLFKVRERSDGCRLSRADRCGRPADLPTETAAVASCSCRLPLRDPPRRRYLFRLGQTALSRTGGLTTEWPSGRGAGGFRAATSSRPPP